MQKKRSILSQKKCHLSSKKKMKEDWQCKSKTKTMQKLNYKLNFNQTIQQ